MRIEITKPNGTHVRIAFSTALLCNRFSAFWIRRSLKKQGVHLTKKQTAAFLKALKKYRKEHTDWKLVEVHTADSEHVEIYP